MLPSLWDCRWRRLSLRRPRQQSTQSRRARGLGSRLQRRRRARLWREAATLLGAGGKGHRWRPRRAGQKPSRGGLRNCVGRGAPSLARRRGTRGFFPKGSRGVLWAGGLVMAILPAYGARHSPAILITAHPRVPKEAVLSPWLGLPQHVAPSTSAARPGKVIRSLATERGVRDGRPLKVLHRTEKRRSIRRITIFFNNNN